MRVVANHAAILAVAVTMVVLSTTTMAFVTPTVATATMQHRRTPKQSYKQAKPPNAVDEILDALDTMLGVSPLAETDLKQTAKNRDDDPSTSWQARAAARQEAAPPSDALDKTSVKVFFLVLGIIPVVSLLGAVTVGGVKPFGL